MAITSKRGRELLGAAADPVSRAADPVSRAIQLEELDWSVETDCPGNGDHIVNVSIGDRCVASFDVDDDLPDDQRRDIMNHLAGALRVGLGL